MRSQQCMKPWLAKNTSRWPERISLTPPCVLALRHATCKATLGWNVQNGFKNMHKPRSDRPFCMWIRKSPLEPSCGHTTAGPNSRCESGNPCQKHWMLTLLLGLKPSCKCENPSWKPYVFTPFLGLELRCKFENPCWKPYVFTTFLGQEPRCTPWNPCWKPYVFTTLLGLEPTCKPTKK